MMSKPPADRKLRIYHQRHDNKQIHATQTRFETEFEKSDDLMIVNYWKNFMAQNRNNSQFQSKRKL